MALIPVEQAIDLLKKHEPVALPTETVYGLAAPIFDRQALERVFEIKGRPLFDPLIVHVESIDQAKEVVEEWPPIYDFLARRFWPGPLTLVVKKKSVIDGLITADQETVALRSPRHPLFQFILKGLGEPLAAPSANRFKKTSPTTAQHVEEEFGPDFPVVDGGSCEVGIESTIVQLSHQSTKTLEILRPGTLTKESLSEALKGFDPQFRVVSFIASETTIVRPGQLIDHYQPSIPLILLQDAQTQEPWAMDLIKVGVELRLPENPTLAARLLYAEMRRLSKNFPTQKMWFQIRPEHLLPAWNPILDRLRKASDKTKLG